jgi:luciferase family oxidoreductase group 1
MRVARALRRTLESDPNDFPRDVMELQSYFADDGQTGIRANPGAGAQIPIWILGSSLFGAQLAAALGLPFAFASHFAPDALDTALDIYRRDFRASAQLDRPYAMAGFNIFAADSDAEGELLASSQAQAFVALRTGQPRQLPPPVPGYRASLGEQGNAILDHVLQCSAVGGPAKVAREIAAFVARTGVDELMIASSIYDHAARKRSLTITAGVMQELKVAA